MSDYDILPRKLPDATAELPDDFLADLPEGALLAASNNVPETAGEIYDMFFDGPPENITQQPGHSADGHAPVNENTPRALRAFISGALTQKMPQLIEYRQKGFNITGLDKKGLHDVGKTLQENASALPESLLAPARHFIRTLNAVVQSAETPPPEILRAIPVVNAVIRHLGAALDDISASRKVSTLNWEDDVEQTARSQREELVTAAAGRLFPQDMPEPARHAGHQWLESILFSPASALSAEYKKFSLLKAALVAESRLTRQRLAGHLHTRALSLLQGAREARAAALDMLLAQADTGQMNPEQLMHWSLGYQLYAHYLEAIDDAPDSGALTGNPLVAAVRAGAREGRTAHARLAASIVPVAAALSDTAVHLLQVKQRTEPAPAEPVPEQQPAPGVTDTIKKYAWEMSRKKGRGVMATSAWLAKAAGNTLSRATYKARHTLQRTPAVGEGTRQAISNTALLLLDEIQQTERRIKRLPGYARVHQEAVQQQLHLSQAITDPQESPHLNDLLSRRLAAEKERWARIAANVAGQTENLLSPLTRLADNTWLNAFYFVLSDELRARPEPGSADALSRMDETVTAVVAQLAETGRQLKASAVRLSGHGQEGGKELQEKIGYWLLTLKTLRSQVKTQAVRLTGQAPDNFSRSGMLARGIGEWAQNLRENYLAELPANERAGAGPLFDTLFMALLAEQRSHFADKDDPQAEGLLKRVSVALKHAAEGTTVYPPTAEEIIAGTRSVPADIRHWAEKKILTGALSAAMSGTFKLLTGPVSLPVRIALRGARTGWTLNKNLRAMNRVRLGEGPPDGAIKNRLINQELSKMALRLTLSLSPAGAYGVAATIVGNELIKGKKGYAKRLAKTVVADLPQEAMWSGLAYGGYAGINAAVRASAERAVQEAYEQARRVERERIERLLQQLMMPDIREDKPASAPDEPTNETTAEDTNKPATQPAETAAPQASSETGEKETSEAAITAQPKKVTKPIPFTFRNPTGRVNFRGDGPGIGISLAPSSRAGNSTYIPSTISDSLKDIAKKIVVIHGIIHPDLTNGQEGAIYQAGEEYYIYIGKYFWPIHLKDDNRGVITLNANMRGKEVEVEVNREGNTWMPTATEEAKRNYPPLPVSGESTPAQEGDVGKRSSDSSVSAEITTKVKKWSIQNSYFYTNMRKGEEGQIYTNTNTKKNYIYISGLYWPIILTGNSTSVITLSYNDQTQEKVINIKVRKVEGQWELSTEYNSRPVPEKSAGYFSIKNYIATFLNTSHAATFNNNDLKKLDNDLYTDPASNKTYILINNHYWLIAPVKLKDIVFREKTEVWQIIDPRGNESLNVVYNTSSKTWEPLKVEGLSTYYYDDGTAATALAADLLAEINKWDPDSAVRPEDSAPGSEGEVYKGQGRTYYIYIKGRYWQFNWINSKTGGVTITTNGVRKLIILQRDKNQWQYFDEEIISDSFDIGSLLNDIKDAELDNDTRTALDSLLLGEKFTSLDNFLSKLQKILEDSFYKNYENLTSEKLKDTLYLRKKIFEIQQNVAYYKPDEENADNQYNWNEGLLAIYQEEFSNEAGQTTSIYAARQALVVAEEAKKRVAQFDPTSIDKQLEKEHAEIKKLNEWRLYYFTLKMPGPIDKRLQYTQPRIDDLDITIKQHTTKVEQLNTLKNSILKRKSEYQKVIDDYKKNYKIANDGMDLAKKTIKNKQSLTGKNDPVKIAEEALIDLTLQKINLRNGQTKEFTTEDLNKLKVLSVAQDMLTQVLERYFLGQTLIQKMSTASITFPAVQNNYRDIDWSNTEAERVYKDIYPENVHPEANQLLAPLLYWLLKNKQDFSTLQLQDIDKVITDYYADAYSLNPLKNIDKMPAGYTPLSHLLGNEYFVSDKDYYQQFVNYKENFSEYEASENTRNLFLSSDISLKDITSKVKRRFRFNVLSSSDVRDKHDGELLFVELEDGNWIFFSLFPGATFSRTFTNKEMMDNVWLRRIATFNPKKIHHHGIESLFLEPFFSKNFDPKNKNKKFGAYKTTKSRDKKELQDFINNILYKGSDDVTYDNPFKSQSYFGMVYDFSLNSFQPRNTLLETLNKSFLSVLNQSATNRKKVLYKATFSKKLADILIPFYAEISGSINDPEHKVDSTSIMLDVVGVCFVAAQAGTKTASLLKNAKGIAKILSEGSKKGLVGKGLQLYALKEMGKEGLINAAKMAKISASALLDLVSPVNIEGLVKLASRKTNFFSSVGKMKSADASSALKSRSIPEKYINTNISVDNLSRTQAHGVDVYKFTASGENNGNYFIKSGDNLYQVRWDDYAHTWRTVDPKNPGRFSYGDPIVFEDGNWVINKKYGGLRGGATDDPRFIMGEQPSREGITQEKVIENLISTKEVNAEAHLNEIKNIRELNSAILSPLEKCESVVPPVAKYMEEKGFTNIRCRAMAFYVNGMDEAATNHFLLVGTKGNQDYAFDITAGQFYGQYSELSGPIIMPEEKWAQKYANLTTARKLIKYADYPLGKWSTAKNDYGSLSPYLSRGPNCQLPNAIVIKRPAWYFPKKTVDDLPPVAADTKKKAGGVIQANPVREAARRSALTTQTPTSSADYAVELLENAELLGKGPATTLRTGIRQATQYQRANAASPGALDGLFASSQVVTTPESLLKVKQGEVLIFMEVDPNFPSRGPRPIHTMVNLGNGRFAGMKNSVLNGSFGDGKQILTAEQLGEFQKGVFKRRGNAQLPDLQIIAGRPKDLQLDYPSLKSLADDATLAAPGNTDIASKTTELLSKSGELAEEQASALKHALTPLLSSGTAAAAHQPVTSLLTQATTMTKQQLATLPKGELVIFDKTADAASARHVMYSLGNGEFFMVNPKHLDAGLPADKAIVRAEQFSDEIFKNRKVYAGKISLANLRVRSLLGQDASFAVSGSKVILTAHGAPSAVNSMDASELAEVIRGLGLRETSKVDWSKITEIELRTCFGAFGTLPTAKVLANILNKKVTAYPFFFSERMRGTTNIVTRARTYLPADLTTIETAKLMKQQSRNHNFWEKLLQLRQKIAAKRVRRSADVFDDLLEDIAKLANGDITADQFFKDYPDYKTGLAVTEGEFKTFTAEAINNDEASAMRCWDILMMSAYTANLVNKYLEG